MISAISAPNMQTNTYKPSFGSVVLARVVLRTTDKNGDIFYTPLMNNEKGIVGIFQSLSRRVNSSKNIDFLNKLGEAIPDFNPKRPIIHSTLIGVRSSFKRFLLTGSDARKARDLGTDLIGSLDNKRSYANMMKNDILNNPNKRVFTPDGDELGIDLIVEGAKGKRKLVDIEMTTVHDISKAKPPKFVSNKKELKKLDKIKPQPKPKQTKPLPKTEKPAIQTEFGFVNELTPKKINPRDYD